MRLDVTNARLIDPVSSIFSLLIHNKSTSHEELGAKIHELKQLVSVEGDKVEIKK